jgi:hypothetical protein
MNRVSIALSTLLFATGLLFVCFNRPGDDNQAMNRLKEGFLNLPDSARPGVYWYFMDGNMSKEAITEDLEAMQKAGIGNVVFLEVNVGVPRGKVDFLSEEWQDMFTHAVREAERLGIAITLGVGPGWTGSGGPWVEGSQSMQHLVSSSVEVSEGSQPIVLPKPRPMKPYFGENVFTPELKEQWEAFYKDVAVLAFPAPEGNFRIKDIEEKALYYRAPYTSVANVKQFLPTEISYAEPPKTEVLPSEQIIDVTRYLKPDGTLEWKVPAGKWTIMRFGCRNNGAVTRPAPLPGLGFEADKFDTAAINSHLENFTGKLLKRTGIPDKTRKGGLKMLHMDSWEMGAQNWSGDFRREFQKRRGYDPFPFFPVYAGIVVENLEKSERFLWDLRQTSQELVIENHAMHLKKYGAKYNMGFSIEPYDMNPTADMELGAVADVPMCEFWSKGFGYNSSFSCIQASSIAHVEGKKVVAAESFTAHKEDWRQYPGSMKNQGDWAFAAGINRLVYHTFQHQYLSDDLKPGMTMGPYGVHHDRSQTWWPMADAYHRYITRCQFLLQKGTPVADILYLTPEGAPHVYRAPASAFTGEDILPDRKGFSTDGCSPSQLLKATVQNHIIIFPSGACYRLLVLPASPTMTPRLLDKIESLISAGAIVLGNPPVKSPGLVNYPESDRLVAEKASQIWNKSASGSGLTEVSYGKGKIYYGGPLSKIRQPELYPGYETAAAILIKMGIREDFKATEAVRYIHETVSSGDIYFVSNKTNTKVSVACIFRASSGTPELWDPMTGQVRCLNEFNKTKAGTTIQLQFEPFESYFIVFNQTVRGPVSSKKTVRNFPEPQVLKELDNTWTVSFNPRWGGPEKVVFDKLEDWTKNENEGIKYYSGIARYQQSVTIPHNVRNSEIYLDLGEVYNLARVYVNGKDQGVVWTAPYRVKITDAIAEGENDIVIEVANLWPNRLIGDEQKPDDGIRNGLWPEWLVKKQPRTSGRFTFTTGRFYQKDSELLKSGLTGPVRIMSIEP